MNQKQIEEALKELDLSDIAFKLSQMALKIISGKKIEEKTFNIPLSVPEELVDVFQMLSDKVGVTIEEMLGHLAKDGFNASIKLKIAEEQRKMQPESETQHAPVDQFQDIAKTLGFDMSGLQEKMNEFQNVVSKLQNIQKVVENVNIPEVKENSSKPNLSTSPIPCPGDGKE